MTRMGRPALAALMFVLSSALIPQLACAQTIETTTHSIAAPAAHPITGVTNRPNSAMVKATAVQKLADGTTITKVTTTKEAGDSEGRTMRQINLDRLNPLGLVRDRRSDRSRCVADGRESERKELEA
jgi:hypothetical protein